MYKRQGSAGFDFLLRPICARAFGVGNESGHKFKDVGLVADVRQRVIAVSYTHLDVYKRQEHRHDNIKGVGKNEDGTSGFEYPFVDIRHIKLVHICLLYTSLPEVGIYRLGHKFICDVHGDLAEVFSHV